MRNLKLPSIIGFYLALLLLPGSVLAQGADVFSSETAVFVLESDPGLADLPPLQYPAQVAVITLIPGPGYHTYANIPGSDALPTEVGLEFSPAPGLAEPVQIRYLPGVQKPDVFEPSVLVNTYSEPTPVFLIFGGQPVVEVKAGLTLLACSDVNCVPIRTELDLRADGDPAPLSANLLEQLRQSLPGELKIQLAGQSAAIFGAADGLSDDLRALLPGFSAMGESGGLADLATDDVVGMPDTSLSSPDGNWNFEPRPLQVSLEVTGLGKALLFGLLAGLILNVMPCVLPVLTMKISTLLAADGTPEERRRNFREHNIFFSAGILTWFAVLALLFGLAGLAWGQIFQSPAVVFALLLLVFALSLSMFDVFHLPVLDLRVGSSANPRVQAYGTGVMATLLATPCSGPLLGGVLGWSLMQGLPVLITVFLATGVGMSLPYLLMAAFPSLANKLPKPGNWMLTFERVMGFLLLATCIYLLSILPASMYIGVLIALLVTAFAAWIWGKYGSLRAEGLKKIVLGGLCLLMVGISVYFIFAPKDAELAWRDFNTSEFNELLGRENLFVEFTADWCPTCKVLEQTTLTPDNLSALARTYDLTLIRVDMTEFDEDAQALLRSLNSASIPLLAVFPAGHMAEQPVVLRDLYSAGQMREAVQSAVGRK